MAIEKILISRTDSIGDVVLTLPLCAWLKEHNPSIEIYFLARNYTKAIVDAYTQIDYFVSWDDLKAKEKPARIEYLMNLDLDCIVHVFPNKEIAWAAYKAHIPMRIGTSHRFFHLFTCNKKVNFSRKHSDLHESQLNFELLWPLGLQKIPSLSELDKSISFFRVKYELEKKYRDLCDSSSLKVILHPKSQGSALEWGIENFIQLSLLLAEKKYTVFFTGTESEGETFRHLIPVRENIFDLTGQFSLEQFIAFINKTDILLAASTGPLHIAGALKKRAIGLFSMRRPIHPGRWQALGENSEAVVLDTGCEQCKSGKNCDCLTKITPEEVLKVISG